MFRNSSSGLRATRSSSLVFAAFLIVTVAASLEASGVTNLSEESRLRSELQLSAEVAPESPPDETFRVPIWIPGFDDDEPIAICSPILTPNQSQKKSSNYVRFRGRFAERPRFGKLTGLDVCSGMLRMLPLILHAAPTRRVEFPLPII
jgi:hypothetical protein